MKCPYCQQETHLVTGKLIYPHRYDLEDKQFYLCKPCDAYVGCHKGTNKPLGRLANAELRRYKIKAHALFDPVWKSGNMPRAEAYKWLAESLNIPAKDCHIGEFDIELCKKVIEICKRKGEENGRPFP